MEHTLDQQQLDDIEEILQKDFMELGVHCIVLIDMAGNIISNLDNGKMKHDIYSLAALAAVISGQSVQWRKWWERLHFRFFSTKEKRRIFISAK